MDWNLAIGRNREALKRIVASLAAMAALTGSAPTLPRHLHRAVAKLLRPAEAAARRLIVIVARGIGVPPPPLRLRKSGPNPTIGRDGPYTGIVMPCDAPTIAPRSSLRALSLPLFDPLRGPRRWTPIRTSAPRILFPGLPGFVPAPLRKSASPDDPVSGVRLAQRLQALASALDDLPRHALRLARLRASRKAAAAHDQKPQTLRPGRRFHRERPLKPGRPPGWRRRSRHEVHHVLDEIHGLAILSLECPDTS